jgi:hypothetical protein
VHLLSQSSAVTHEGVKNTYMKGDLFCVMLETRVVYKYPVQHIFRVKEYPRAV